MKKIEYAWIDRSDPDRGTPCNLLNNTPVTAFYRFAPPPNGYRDSFAIVSEYLRKYGAARDPKGPRRKREGKV